MRSLAEMRRGFPSVGELVWIGVRPERKAALRSVESCAVTASGLSGDHAPPGKRAVTLIQAEHIPVIAALCVCGSLSPDVLRRNLIVSGINLMALREHGVRIGALRLRITTPCAPCSRMEQTLGKGGYNAMRGHGGWCAEVLTPAVISVMDPVTADIN